MSTRTSNKQDSSAHKSEVVYCLRSEQIVRGHNAHQFVRISSQHQERQPTLITPSLQDSTYRVFLSACQVVGGVNEVEPVVPVVYRLAQRFKKAILQFHPIRSKPQIPGYGLVRDQFPLWFGIGRCGVYRQTRERRCEHRLPNEAYRLPDGSACRVPYHKIANFVEAVHKCILQDDG